MMIRDRVRELRRVPARLLKPHPSNWREHPKAQREALKGVLAEIGYADALLARELEDGTLELIDGHLRAETTPDTEVPVLILDVDAAEAAKLLLTIDPLSAMAEANKDMLRSLLSEVTINSDAVSAMLSELARSNGVEQLLEGLTEPDEVPEPPTAATTKVGDLWILGEHRLLCGDSGNAADVDRLVDGQPVHMVNSDPPYNVNVEPASGGSDTGAEGGGKRPKHSWRSAEHQTAMGIRPPSMNSKRKQTQAKGRRIIGDKMSDDDFAVALRKWFGNMARVLVPGGGFYLWGGYVNIRNYPPALEDVGMYFSQCLIWHKMHPVITRKDFMGDHEWCFYGWKEGAAHRFFGPNNVPDVWNVKKVNPQSMIHLTEKPVELAARAIGYSSNPGERVLDLFGGSGSTLIACQQLGRCARVMELDPLYADVIVERYEKFTGQKAMLEGDGRTFEEVRAERAGA